MDASGVEGSGRVVHARHKSDDNKMCGESWREPGQCGNGIVYADGR